MNKREAATQATLLVLGLAVVITGLTSLGMIVVPWLVDHGYEWAVWAMWGLLIIAAVWYVFYKTAQY